MRFKDQFGFVKQNMKKNKTRIFMTVLATAMGCAFLIVLASVGFGIHKSIVKENLESRIVTEIEVFGKQDEESNYHQITEKDIPFFEDIEDVKAVTRRQMLQQQGKYTIDGFKVDAETFIAHMPSEVKAGFELSKGRLPEKDDEIIVGFDFVTGLIPADKEYEEVFDEKGMIKEEFQYKKDIIGKQINLDILQIVDGVEKKKTLALKVVGVGKKPTKDWAIDRNAFISEATLKEIEEFTGTPKGMVAPPDGRKLSDQLKKEEQPFDQVKLYAKNMEAVEGITTVLENNQYQTYSVIKELKEVNVIFTIIKAGLIFIGTIAIIIASIGIYNTMTMAVTERAPDIGIMKAIGASPGTIKKIFLIESSYIGLLGAFFGTVVAYGISLAVNFAIPLILSNVFDEQPPEGLVFSHIPLSLPLICVTICLLVTILSGMRPAQRATRVDVLKAMRREV